MAFRCRVALISIATVLIFSQRTVAELVVKPTDTEALVDEITYFNCSTSVVSQDVQWFHFPVGDSGDRNFVYGYDQFYNQYRDRFTIEKNQATGTFNLVIRSVQVQDAGRYECQDDVGRGTKASARLVVLDQRPLCHSNQKTNEVIGPNTCGIPVGELQLTCIATYYGDDAPVLKWFQDGSDQPLVDGTSFLSSGNRYLSNLTLKADSIKDGSSFECRTTRSRLTPHKCTSGSFKIIGTSMATTCSSTEPYVDATLKPYVDAILVTWLFLIPIIIAASVVGGIYLQARRPFKILTPAITEPILEEESFLKPEDEQPMMEGQFDKSNEQKDNDIADLKKKIKQLEDEKHKLEDEKSELEDEKRKLESEKRKLVDDKSELGDEKRKLEDEKRKLEDEKRKLEDEKRQLEDDKRELEDEKRELEDEKRELEERLYPPATTSYSDNPKEVTAIDIQDPKTDSKKKKKPIFGMTILSNKLFVVTEKSFEIKVYDSVTFIAEPKLPISELSNPLDIASCSTNNCLYICDGGSVNEMVILRVDANANKTPLVRWSLREDAGYLSVARKGNVVVSLFNGNKINEYSPDGQLIIEVKLSPADNISHPWHAIKTTSIHFICSHGIGDDPLQRVCVANADGKIIKSFGGRKGSDIEAHHMNRPVHLLEDSSRNVLVADMKNKRVLLLSPTLELKGVLVSADKSKLRFPMRLCIDDERGILFVADNNYTEKACTYDSGRILIFSCKT